MGEFQQTIRALNTFEKPKSREELIKWTKELTSNKNPEYFLSVVRGLLNNFKFQKFENQIYKRWHDDGLPSLNTFAPYAFYYSWVLQAYSYGTAFELFSTRSTNLLDIQYVFYLPFCYMFVTNDSFQRDFANLFATSQTTVNGGDFKTDLENITSYYENLSQNERTEREFQYGSYPPENKNSITSQMWKKYMRPWKPGSGNRAVRHTREEEKKIAKDIQDKIKNSYEDGRN